MKIILIANIIFSSLFCDPLFEVEINEEFTRERLLNVVSDAKSKGVRINILYDSYYENGKLKTLQIEVVYKDRFKSKSTYSTKYLDCYSIIVDPSEDSKTPFFVGECGKEHIE